MNAKRSLNGMDIETKATRSDRTNVEVSGALAGLVGGVMMAIVGAILALAIGDDLWKAPKLIATFVVSPDSVAAPGFLAGPVIIGSMIHLALSVLFGVGFGILTTRIWKMPLAYGAPMVFGFVYGLAIWLIAYFIVLPLHLQETFSDVVKTDKTGLSKTAHTRWMISAFANFLPGSTIFRLA